MKPWKLSGDLEVDSCGASNGNLVHISNTAMIPKPTGIKARYAIRITNVKICAVIFDKKYCTSVRESNDNTILIHCLYIVTTTV